METMVGREVELMVDRPGVGATNYAAGTRLLVKHDFNGLLHGFVTRAVGRDAEMCRIRVGDVIAVCPDEVRAC